MDCSVEFHSRRGYFLGIGLGKPSTGKNNRGTDQWIRVKITSRLSKNHLSFLVKNSGIID